MKGDNTYIKMPVVWRLEQIIEPIQELEAINGFFKGELNGAKVYLEV